MVFGPFICAGFTIFKMMDVTSDDDGVCVLFGPYILSFYVLCMEYYFVVCRWKLSLVSACLGAVAAIFHSVCSFLIAR